MDLKDLGFEYNKTEDWCRYYYREILIRIDL